MIKLRNAWDKRRIIFEEKNMLKITARVDIIFIISIFLFTLSANAQDEIENKVNKLMSQMTVEEKIGQLQQFTGTKGVVINKEHLKMVKQGKVGSFLNVWGVKNVNPVQKIAVKESRLKIPLIFGFDVIHGFRTVFPVPLGIASSWDMEAAELSASISAEEAYASGVKWTFAPMVDIARDPRWGRIVEGAGEDPYLCSEITKAYVRGFQGNDYSKKGKLVACAKHWAAYGAAEAGRDYNTADVSERTLREIYFPPFKAAVESGVGTFMSAFNEINGVPASANHFTLTRVLRGEWKFDGFVVSDYTSVEELIKHGIASDHAEAARAALTAGVDMEMVSTSYNENLKRLLKEGKINIQHLDEAVKRILRIKFRAGLFENPYVDESLEDKVILTEEKIKAARKIAGRSIVLLKNKKVLPLKKDLKIALIGPLADNKEELLGPWSGRGKKDDVVTVYEAFREKAGINNKIIYAEGCGITNNEKSGFQDAVAAVKSSDIAVVVVGEVHKMSGEASSRAVIDLPGVQLDLLKEIAKTGKPFVVVLINGRPLIINWVAENASAILEAWFGGIQAGNAIADVIFGDVNPGAKLPVSFPREIGQIPIYYNYKNTGRPFDSDQKYTSRYLDTPNTPLYPFGFGLSYTEFKISELKLSGKNISKNDKLNISVKVKNTGKRNGDEVVQLYIRDVTASVTRPVRELKRFKRINLDPGEEKLVEFTITEKDLRFYDIDMNYIAEPGRFVVFTGNSSEGGLTAEFVLND